MMPAVSIGDTVYGKGDQALPRGRVEICYHPRRIEKERRIVTRKTLVLATVAIAIAATALAGTQSTDQTLDPVRVAPDTHKIAFENAFVRVLEVRIPAGKIEPRHRHPHGLSVYFTDWEAKVTVDGRPPQVNQRKMGTFAWSDAVVHTVENVGKSEGRVLRIELKH